MIISRKITIVKINKPIKKDLNEELQWLGNSLGLFSLRDKDKSCFRIFIELLKAAKLHEQLTSDDLALRLNLTRGTVIHHLNRLMDAGIVLHVENKYVLRVENLEDLIHEIQRDVHRTIIDLKEIAEDIDRYMGL
jgi:predicted transcriptional regulator